MTRFGAPPSSPLLKKQQRTRVHQGETQLVQTIGMIDTNHDGEVSWDEYYAGTAAQHQLLV